MVHRSRPSLKMYPWSGPPNYDFSSYLRLKARKRGWSIKLIFSTCWAMGPTAVFLRFPGCFLHLTKTFSQVAQGKLDLEALPLVFTRGMADVTPLKQLLSSKGESVWTEEVGAFPAQVRSNSVLTWACCVVSLTLAVEECRFARGCGLLGGRLSLFLPTVAFCVGAPSLRPLPASLPRVEAGALIGKTARARVLANKCLPTFVHMLPISSTIYGGFGGF